MTVIGFVFYTAVLLWSLEHNAREAQNMLASRSDDVVILTFPPDIALDPLITDPPTKTPTTAHLPTAQQVPIAKPPEPQPTPPPTRQPKSKTTTRKFQPRVLIINTDGDIQQSYRKTSIPNDLNGQRSKSRSIEFILPPGSNSTSSPTAAPAAPIVAEDPKEAVTPDPIKEALALTLSPVQERREQCIPQEKWQTDSYVNCNQLHELDMAGSSRNYKLIFLGQGWFRAAWKLSFIEYDAFDGETGVSTRKESALVLKTLRLEREFLDEYFELHRRDAVAMERLTWSPYVLDVYGYCGQSAMNELATFRNGVDNLEQLDRAMRNVKIDDSKQAEKLNYMKLKIAASVATGLSHIHMVHQPKSEDENPSKSPPALMAHYDVNPRNIAVVSQGRPKLNDFNIAEFIQYNPNTNSSCGFPSRLHEPWWRAPEEMFIPNNTRTEMRLVTEKVDVYALGAVLFHILTTHAPRGKMKKERMDHVRKEVAQGVAPKLPAPYNTTTSPAVKAFRQAMDLCFVVDPVKRGTAHEVASLLQNMVKKYENAGF
eukprot:scaffold2939_cov123-Cylindrotheca_fusiformis.AAC.3